MPKPARNPQGWVQPLRIVLRGKEREILVTFRLNVRAKSLKLKAKSVRDVQVTVPPGVSPTAAIEFLDGHVDWLRQALEKTPEPVSVRRFVMEQGWLSIAGERWGIEEVDRGHEQGGTYSDATAQKVIINLPLGREDDDAFWVWALHEAAKPGLQFHLITLVSKLDISLPPLTVRNQSSRWGSCSSKGRLNLNWRLILLPQHLQDYVIYHELAHLKEMNHGSDFWDLLHSYDPRAGRHDVELRKMSRKIINLGT